MKKVFNKIMKLGLISSFLSITPLIMTSCGFQTSSKYFAEVIVSGTTSVLKDNAFNQSSYIGFQEFVNSKEKQNPNGNNDVVNSNSYSLSNDDSRVGKEWKKIEEKSNNLPNIDTTNESDQGNKQEFLQGNGIWRRAGSVPQNTFKWVLKGGVKILITPGFDMQQPIEGVYDQFPNSGFLLLDGMVNTNKEKPYTNVSTFEFRAEQSGFLAGIATCQFLLDHKEVYKTDGGLKVGGFVGLPFPSTLDFLAGFQMGVLSFNLKQTNKENKVEWISQGNDVSDYSSGSFSVGNGITKANELISNGADAIIPIAGAQTSDVVDAVRINSKKKPIIVIGVDSPQEKNVFLNKPFPSDFVGVDKIKDSSNPNSSEPKIIQFSAVKKIDVATYLMLSSIFNKNDPNNLKKIITNSYTKNQSESIPKNTSNEVQKDESYPVGGFGFKNIGTYENFTTGISDAGLTYIQKSNSDWVKENTELNKLELVPERVYSDVAYKFLQDKGVLINNNLLDLDENKLNNLSTKDFVKSSVISSDGNNRVIFPMPSGNKYNVEIKNKNLPFPQLLFSENKISEFVNSSNQDQINVDEFVKYLSGNVLNGSNWGPFKNNNI